MIICGLASFLVINVLHMKSTLCHELYYFAFIWFEKPCSLLCAWALAVARFKVGILDQSFLHPMLLVVWYFSLKKHVNLAPLCAIRCEWACLCLVQLYSGLLSGITLIPFVNFEPGYLMIVLDLVLFALPSYLLPRPQLYVWFGSPHPPVLL